MRLLSAKEAAARLGCHPETIRRLIRAGRIPARVLNPEARRPTYLIPEDWIAGLARTEAGSTANVEWIDGVICACRNQARGRPE